MVLIVLRLLAPSLVTDFSHLPSSKPHLIEMGLFHVFTHVLMLACWRLSLRWRG